MEMKVEKYNFNHERLKIVNWIDHKKLLKMYEKSSISVVNPTWQEPFDVQLWRVRLEDVL